MSRFVVRTLTLNPSIDVSSEAETVRPTRKIRTLGERMDPGGGGINVARVLHRFGVATEAVFLAGGATGAVLDGLLDRHGIARRAIAADDDTRMSLTVHERSSGLEYRFVPEGPEVGREELDACLEASAEGACDYFVASGSLPRGTPDDFYARIADRLPTDTKLVIDTSGTELRASLARGGLFLVKPSRGELEHVAGRPLPDHQALADEARKIVAAGQAQLVAVTLGRDGALLANKDGAAFLPALPVKTRSAVGAGDAFVAAMVYGFVSGLTARDAFRLGAAAGAATALTPGTDLCHPEDVKRLLPQVPQPERLATSDG